MRGLLRELFDYRRLLGILVLRDLRLRYRGMGLGYLWSLVNPLLLLLTYSFVFSRILHVRIPDFPLYLGCGILPWIWFTHSITAGSRSVEQGKGLLRRGYFPAPVLPVVQVVAQFVHFLLGLLILEPLLVLEGHVPGASLVALVPLFLVQLTLLSGLALLVAALGVRFLDVEYVIANALLILFFLAAIVYQPESVPADIRPLLWVNPLAVLVDGYRAVLFYGTWPAWPRVAGAALTALVALWLGSAVFGRLRWTFAEHL